MPDSRPEVIRNSVENSLKRLGCGHIDLYYQHRVDPSVPIEEVAGVMGELIQEGKITHWGLSEADEEAIRRAHAVCPVTAIQNRYSMMARWHEALFPVLEELQIGYVAFSPLANGFLSAKYNKDTKFEAGTDYRSVMPQFTPEGIEQNEKLLELIKGVEIDLKFNRTARDLNSAKALFEENAGQILSGAQNLANDYEKEKFVHDALIERISYQMSAEMNQSAYSALVNGQTVCAGYARAFQYLMQQLGVPCYYCTGYAGENHAWNIVRLDDGYYNVDTTWDDTGDGTYDYFNKTDADYADSHLRQEMSVYLPSCDGQAYRGLEPENGGLRSLEEAGIAEEQVITDMPGYYADCYEQILQNGIGSYTFYNVIEGEELFRTWYREHQTEKYKEAYMREALAGIGASSCEMTLEAEELQGGRYLISHAITVR